jgi:hypothetical protein
MSITTAALGETVWGNKRVRWGTYTESGAGGGDISTGLHTCEGILLQPYGSSVTGNESVVDETLPVAGSAVTIACDASQVGLWIAFGD